MRHITFAILFVSVIVGCSREVNMESTVTRDGLVYELDSDKPYTGIAFSYRADGQLSGTANYKDGKWHGSLIWFYDDGQIRGTGNYKDGREHGEAILYYENGQTKSMQNYLDGKLELASKVVYKNGQCS